VTSGSAVSLTWNSPLLEHQNGAITGYIVLVTPANSQQSYQVSSGTTSFIVSSLTPNSLYTFAVAAQTRIGRGPYSNSIILTTNPHGIAIAITHTYNMIIKLHFSIGFEFVSETLHFFYGRSIFGNCVSQIVRGLRISEFNCQLVDLAYHCYLSDVYTIWNGPTHLASNHSILRI